MHLVYVQNMRLPTEKAHGYQVMKMCQGFAKSGHRLTLIVPNRNNTLKSDAFEYYGMTRSFEVFKCPVIDLMSFKAPHLISLFTYALERKTFSWSLKSRLPKDAEAFYTRDPWLAPKIKSWTKKPVFLELHALPNTKQIKKLKSIEAIFCLTRWMEREINKILPNTRTAFLPDAVDLETFDPKVTRDEARSILGIPKAIKMIVYGGKFTTMEKGKGLSMLDTAVKRIFDQGENALLYLIGGSSEEYRCVEKKEPSSTTICIPHVKRERLALYYRAADVLVMPFPNTHHYAHEMSPLKLFEYMASGTPIITTDLPSIREILDKNMAYFVKPNDTNEMQDSIFKALTDLPQAQQLAKRAHSRVIDNTWENRSNVVLNFVLNLVS